MKTKLSKLIFVCKIKLTDWRGEKRLISSFKGPFVCKSACRVSLWGCSHLRNTNVLAENQTPMGLVSDITSSSAIVVAQVKHKPFLTPIK